MTASNPTDRELDDLADSLAPFSQRMVLTGAGFPKPWGGYLAAELWSAIVSNPALRSAPETDRVLHDNPNFEDALAIVQADPATFGPENGEKILWKAIMDAFGLMDRRLTSWRLSDRHTVVGNLLREVTAAAAGSTTCFFTLNQDVFLERTIQQCDPTLPWLVVPQGGPALAPGVLSGDPSKVTVPPFAPAEFAAIKDRPSYVKLHGSMNWREHDGTDVVVLGGAKTESIKRFPILRMNHAIFRRALKGKDARLLIIGYGFGDDHINEAIAQAVAAKNGFAIWIVDPRSTADLRRTWSTRGAVWHSVSGHSASLMDLFGTSAPDREMFRERFWIAP